MTDVLMATYDYCDSIKKSTQYQMLKTLNQNIEKQYASEISAFNEAKRHYYEVMEQGGSYHPDFKETAKHLSQTKKTLYEKPEVMALIKLENELQNTLNDLIREVTLLISPYIKVPNEVGLIKEKESCHASKKNGLHR